MHNSQDITVLNLRLINNSTNLRALADVKVGQFTFNSCRVIKQSGQAAWAQLPQNQGQNGKYHPIVSCQDKSLETAIKSAILSAFEKGGVQ